MSKFEPYNIVLKDFTGTHTVEYTLDDVFFQKIDSPEVQRGNVKAVVNVRKRGDVFELAFRLDGFILVPCDRCLDDMELPITHRENLLVNTLERLNRAATHQMDWLRTVISKAKEEMRYSNGISQK